MFFIEEIKYWQTGYFSCVIFLSAIGAYKNATHRQKNPVNYAPYRHLKTASCFDTQERSLMDQIMVKKN